MMLLEAYLFTHFAVAIFTFPLQI